MTRFLPPLLLLFAGIASAQVITSDSTAWHFVADAEPTVRLQATDSTVVQIQWGWSRSGMYKPITAILTASEPDRRFNLPDTWMGFYARAVRVYVVYGGPVLVTYGQMVADRPPPPWRLKRREE